MNIATVFLNIINREGQPILIKKWTIYKNIYTVYKKTFFAVFY